MKKSELEATIEALMQENQRLVDMFKKEIYIESIHADPGYYDLSLRGKCAMLIIGQLIQIFRESGGKNFLTNTLQLTLPDGKTRELFELTIQKVDGADSPAMKIERLEKENQDLKEQLDMKISSCDALPLLRAKDEEIGQMQIIINRLRDDLEVAHAAKVHNDWR